MSLVSKGVRTHPRRTKIPRPQRIEMIQFPSLPKPPPLFQGPSPMNAKTPATTPPTRDSRKTNPQPVSEMDSETAFSRHLGSIQLAPPSWLSAPEFVVAGVDGCAGVAAPGWKAAVAP